MHGGILFASNFLSITHDVGMRMCYSTCFTSEQNVVSGIVPCFLILCYGGMILLLHILDAKDGTRILSITATSQHLRAFGLRNKYCRPSHITR